MLKKKKRTNIKNWNWHVVPRWPVRKKNILLKTVNEFCSSWSLLAVSYTHLTELKKIGICHQCTVSVIMYIHQQINRPFFTLFVCKLVFVFIENYILHGCRYFWNCFGQTNSIIPIILCILWIQYKTWDLRSTKIN